MTTQPPQQAFTPDHYAAIGQAFKALPEPQQQAMLSAGQPAGPVVDMRQHTRQDEWQPATCGLSGPRCLPAQDERVELRLAGGEETEGQLTWAYRWLLVGGRVKLLQEVTHWRPLR